MNTAPGEGGGTLKKVRKGENSDQDQSNFRRSDPSEGATSQQGGLKVSKLIRSVVRGPYGEIIECTGIVFQRAKEILKNARKKGLIESPFDNTEFNRRKGKRFGKMLNVDIYDVAPGAVLIQHRYLQMHKYGTDVRKEYFLVRRKNGKITVDNRKDDKPRIMKLAKSELPVGSVIAAITGKKVIKIKIAPVVKQVGFKAMKLDDDGNLRSVWDNSIWELYKTRIEAATPDHSGGFFCYRNLNDCLDVAENADVFGEARSHDNLVIVEVETSGKSYDYRAAYGLKICTTRMKVVRVYGELSDFYLEEAA
jgi:hypothetical protein